MAAKKKKVAVQIDVEVLEQLAEVAGALSELASASIASVDDPILRARLKKTAKKGR